MKETGIEITSVTDKAIGLKLPVVALENLLNEKIKLKDYGVEIKKIFIVFIVVPPTNIIHEEHVIYTEAEEHLEIAIRLDYEEVLASDPEDCKEIMQTCLLKALRASIEISAQNFNWRKLIKILEKI